jgi:hypothetical protein
MDFPGGKIDGGVLSAAEYNQTLGLNNAISSTGQIPSSSDLNQLSKTLAVYGGQGGIFCNDTGLANAYVVAQVAPLSAPFITPLQIGTTIVFRPGADNTGACSVNPFSHGVNSIKLENGTSDPGAGELSTTRDAKIIWNGTDWLLSGKPIAATITSTGVSYLSKPINISNNVGTPTTKIDFTAGNFNFYDGSGQGTMTAKTGDLANLFGTSDGMLDSGVVGEADYALFTVYNPTTGDSKPLASLSRTTPLMTLPNADGYTVLGKTLGWIVTDSSNNIRTADIIYKPDGSFDQMFHANIENLDDSSIPTIRTPISTSAPPNTVGIFNITYLDSDATTSFINVKSANDEDIVPTSRNSTVAADGGSYDKQSGYRVLVDATSQIYYRGNDSSAAVFAIYCTGFNDNLN